MSKMNAVVLAGGNGKCDLQEGVGYKSLAKILGVPMVRYCVDGLRASPLIGQITVIGPAADLRAALEGCTDVVCVEGLSELHENMEMALSTYPTEAKVLIATADVPLIDGPMITWLCEQCAALDKDFIYPIIPREAVEAKYEGMKRTYVRLKEGEFTGGNISCVSPAAALSNGDLIRKLIQFRKRPDKTAGLLGLKFVMGLMAGKLRIEDIEARAAEISHLRLQALICPYPEIGNDVDHPGDIEAVEKILKKK